MLHDPGRKSRFTAGSVITPGSLYSLENTRSTFPSTAGTASPEADGRDGSRCVVTDTGQSAEGVVVGWQLSAVLCTDELCSLLQIPHTAVIAQSFPTAYAAFSSSQAASAGISGSASRKR